MASSSSAIPDRTSSLKADISKRRLVLKDSKADLKRRLSKASFEASPVECIKLRAGHLEAEVEDGLLLILAGWQKRLGISSSEMHRPCCLAGGDYVYWFSHGLLGLSCCFKRLSAGQERYPSSGLSCLSSADVSGRPKGVTDSLYRLALHSVGRGVVLDEHGLQHGLRIGLPVAI